MNIGVNIYFAAVVLVALLGAKGKAEESPWDTVQISYSAGDEAGEVECNDSSFCVPLVVDSEHKLCFHIFYPEGSAGETVTFERKEAGVQPEKIVSISGVLNQKRYVEFTCSPGLPNRTYHASLGKGTEVTLFDYSVVSAYHPWAKAQIAAQALHDLPQVASISIGSDLLRTAP